MTWCNSANSKILGLKVSLGVSLALLGGIAVAEPAQGAFTMMAVIDRASGASLLAGKHEEAIRELSKRLPRRAEAFEVNNNLCVAYVQAREIEKAEAACDTAVEKSKRGPSHEQAIALSNRGVLRALSGDHFGALYDLLAATHLKTHSRVAQQNLHRMHSRISSPDFLAAD